MSMQTARLGLDVAPAGVVEAVGQLQGAPVRLRQQLQVGAQHARRRARRRRHQHLLHRQLRARLHDFARMSLPSVGGMPADVCRGPLGSVARAHKGAQSLIAALR